MRRLHLEITFKLLLLTTLCGCDDSRSPATPAVDASGSITSAGGTVVVTRADSPIRGARVVVPPEAVPAGDVVRIDIHHDSAPPAPAPNGAVAVAPTLELTKSQSNNFQHPVVVTVPFDRTKVDSNDVLVVAYWDATYQRYYPVSIQSLDMVAGTVSFHTIHFSSFVTWIADGIADQLPTVDTGFRPAVDGFHDHNFGAYDSPGGSCLGMANYSTWYYVNRKATDGTALFQKYAEGDPLNEEDDKIQHEVISRSFMAASQVWAHRWLMASYALGDTGTGLLLVATLHLTQQPQTMLLRTGGGGHAVVVYAFDPAQTRFFVYDNNFPGEVVTVDWTVAGGFQNYSKAAAYGGVTKIGFEAFSSYLEASQFESIYSGAESGFQDSKFVQMTISNPVPAANGTVPVPASSTTDVQFAGSATGGILPARFVVVKVNGTKKLTTAVNPLGGFQFQLPAADLANPSNTVALIATSDQWNPWNAYAGYEEIRVVRENFFRNLGFEAGDFTAWAHETHTWQNTTPGSFLPEKSAVVGTGLDPIAGLTLPYRGNHACRINNSDNGYHISTVTQTATVPNVARLELKFFWAAVLEDPNHLPTQQPNVDIQVIDDTTQTILYSQHFYSDDPSYSGWLSLAGGSWKAIPWQAVVVDVSGLAGHSLRLQVTGADCSLGGHGGYVYLDGDQ